MTSSEISQDSVQYPGGLPSWSVVLRLARGRLLPTGSRKKPSWRRQGRCLGRPAPPAGGGRRERPIRGRRWAKNPPQASASASSASFYSDVCTPSAPTQRHVAEPIRMTLQTTCEPGFITEEESRIAQREPGQCFSLASFFYAQSVSTITLLTSTLSHHLPLGFRSFHTVFRHTVVTLHCKNMFSGCVCL